MKKPDMLLTEIERSIFVKALVISIIAHVLLLAATSFPLFADWSRYGVHSPSYINAQKAKENKEAEAARRKKEIEEKAEAASREKSGEAAKADAKGAAPAAKPADGKAEAAAAKDEPVTPPELEPLPPKKEFQLGDDLTLD